MSGTAVSIRKSVRVFELEGIVESLTLERYDDGRPYINLVVGSETMTLPVPVELGGRFNFPVDIDEGKPVAVRSFLVPAVDRETGVLADSKRYVFADPDAGPVTLDACMTREAYLATDYPGKPKSIAAATPATEAF